MRRAMMRDRRKGSAIVEATFMMPWIAFLFVGILDFGFYAYAGICTQNAARAAAILCARPSLQVNSVACQAALRELKELPNMGSITSCASSASGVSASQPAAAWVTTLTNATSPKCADCTVDPSATSAQAWVTYQTLPMIPIPGVLTGQITLTRSAEMRILQ